MNPCKCQHWARSFDPKLPPTNHHPNCEHYNDSLVDVWKVTVSGCSCYVMTEQDARETAGEDESGEVTVTKEKMHREVFEHMPEFNGF